MPNSKEIVYIRGPIHWTKVLGDPVDNYDKNGREWTFDLALDKAGVKQMNGIKVQGKPVKNIKNRDDDRGDFVQFKQKFREPEDYERYGQKVRTVEEQRIKVMDAEGNPWDQDVKIGNGTIADVKFEVVDYGKGKYAGVYPRAIRVLKHVPYEAQEFAPINEDDPYYTAPRPKAMDRTVGDIIDSLDYTENKDEIVQSTYGGHTASDDLDDDIPLD